MPEIQTASVAMTEEQVTTPNVLDSFQYPSLAQIVGEAIRDWQVKREIRNKEMSRLEPGC